MSLNSKELTELADHLLESELKDKLKNKIQTTSYPILSESQLKRRGAKEIPYSNLTNRQRMECRAKHYEYDVKEGD